MGCDIHIVIQRRAKGSDWTEIAWQDRHEQQVPGVAVAPKMFNDRNYNLFAIIAGVRDNFGFQPIADSRGFPEGFDPDTVLPCPRYPEEGPRYLGDHSFTWVTLDELTSYPWDDVVHIDRPATWFRTAREATDGWPTIVLPWLVGLADGAELRLVIGFDS